MTANKAHARAVLLVALAVAICLAMVPAPPASAVTKAQVDAACADSREQHEAYRAAQQRFRDATAEYDAILVEIERLERKQNRIQGSAENADAQRAEIEAAIQQQAVEIYMQGGTSTPGIILSASSLDEFLTTTEFLCRHIFDAVAKAARDGALGADGKGLARIRVTLSETDLARASFEGPIEG